jgi:DinB superfamily
MRDWATLVARHSQAVEGFVQTSRRIPPERWNQPIAPGKWSPAEITSHLIESYQVLGGELAGGPGMQLRLTRLKRWMLRYTVLRRILASGNFPAGARAPRETRPRDLTTDPKAALQTLSTRADGFVQELTDRARSGRVQLTHAYFGRMSARQSLILVTVHTGHHARQLAPAATA